MPNPSWPYLDDESRMGHYLTTTGNPPDCPCNPGPDEGDFECVTDGCGPGHDCCLPSNIKELGAGFMITDSPAPFKVLRPEVAYMQFDGLFAPVSGSEKAYNLSSYLGTEYKNDRDVTFITDSGGNGDSDGDGVADGNDEYPNDPNLCGDFDSDGCDDCSSGHYEPGNDGPDADGDGACDSGDPDANGDGDGDGDGGCRSAGAPGGAAPLVVLFALVLVRRRRRRG